MKNAAYIANAVRALEETARVLDLPMGIRQYEELGDWVVSADFHGPEVSHNVMLFFRGPRGLALSACPDGWEGDDDQYRECPAFRSCVNRELAVALKAVPLSGCARRELEKTAERLHPLA